MLLQAQRLLKVLTNQSLPYTLHTMAVYYVHLYTDMSTCPESAYAQALPCGVVDRIKNGTCQCELDMRRIGLYQYISFFGFNVIVVIV